MALVVNTNVPSIASQRYLMESRKEMETAMERLSSGKRINSAGDDAAGLAISTRMDSQITGLNMAIRNANDGISLMQTAEGALDEVSQMLQRMRELALQSVHGVNNDADREALDAEVQQLKLEIDRVAESTTFNDQQILNGSFDRLLQIGYERGDTLNFAIGDMSASALGMNAAAANESSDSVNVLVSARLTDAFTNSRSFDAGDIVINGQEVGAWDASTDDIYDLTTAITDNVDNVTASAFNTMVAKTIGSGTFDADQVFIKVDAIGAVGDDWYQVEREVSIAASNSLEEMVENINAEFINDEVYASINDDGKLVLTNNTGSAISLVDVSGTDTAYDGATGFLVGDSANITVTSGTLASADWATEGTVNYGFLKLESSDGSPIEVETGNADLAAPGSTTDLGYIGFNMIKEDPTGSSYTVVGNAMTLTDTMSRSSSTLQADLSINGVEIYDATLSAASNTFQGKLDLINAFSDDTGVVASTYFEKVYDTSSTTFVVGNTYRVNGIDVTLTGSTATAFATQLNSITGTTGITAEVNGDNLKLSGDGVQNVNIQAIDYELTAATTANDTLASVVTAGTSRTVTIADADVEAGRTIVITLGAATTHVTATTYSHTVVAGESANDVMQAIYDDILNDVLAVDPGFGTVGSVGGVLTLTAATITFATFASLGSVDITLSVTQIAAAKTLNISSTSANYYGTLKLQATDNSPISIELGEGAASKSYGLTEVNVGDSTWDANAPTQSVSSESGSSISGMSVSTSGAAEAAIDTIDGALATVTDARASFGAYENRLNSTVSNLSNIVENTSAAQSRIQDADFAAEAAALARAQILQQAGTAMLAQANAAPQNVLSLLG
ncbi:flagellin [Litoricolaceae bacterium]|nr:flagellin [Litorivicinaceae bacterium]